MVENVIQIKNGIMINVNNGVKIVPLRSYSGPYFPTFGLNTERYGVSLCILSECGKIRTRITPNMNTFHAVDVNVKNMIYMKKITFEIPVHVGAKMANIYQIL